jgi:hypothetical protein
MLHPHSDLTIHNIRRLDTSVPQAHALLHGGDEVMQREEEWEGGNCAEFGGELDGLQAINEEYDCHWLNRKSGGGLENGFGMPERPGVQDEHIGSQLRDGICVEPRQHIHGSDLASRIH